MKPIQVIVLLFLAVPFAEIYLLLFVGSFVGAFPTVLLVVFTAVLGAWLLRQQGFATWQRLQASLSQGQIPAYEIIEGPILLVGGALLLTPGFVTDAIGFAALVPALRRKLARFIIEKNLVNMQVPPFTNSNPNSNQINGDIIEGELNKDQHKQDD